MNSEMIKFFLSGAVPCGFADSEGEIKANAKMVDFLGLNKDAPEMVTLLEKIRTEKSPFFVIINLVSDFNKAPKIWQFHFLPLFCSENSYLGTFFHAHEFLFLSPLEYVDGMQPYFVTTEKPNKLFTDKEWEVLFFTMHRLSSKEIARRLNIGTRTTNNHLNIIYEKAGVHSGCQLRAFGKSKGFDRYIPYNLIFSRQPLNRA
ncbi:LuxR C-terminal-related transcriptional regulator (plasmid) [Arsenophonus nasoniae]|uniref:LuxR C-terminal-related transcriptional regulator n=1 Tax=Arsenophonus nasoniae TaxID=638 RepID=A0ABY8NV17_9GAMM|nr:LuxR C-terminal-related transcriptional regulator [Arsenophonus nasoniae]WGM08258.1 LuxR C-terminal-related transcriptional regulator [Arsenophonus nasoniae]WGM17685.1 LuxR C-terminal-related transcriptional regulator [Arsenophonus nasoniae]